MAQQLPHLPWTMHPAGLPYVICGRDGPSFGPVTFAGARADMMTIATVMHAAADLLAALRIARSYVQVAIEEYREERAELDAADPHRSGRARAEDAETLAGIEGHLRQIDAAIAKAEGAP